MDNVAIIISYETLHVFNYSPMRLLQIICYISLGLILDYSIIWSVCCRYPKENYPSGKFYKETTWRKALIQFRSYLWCDSYVKNYQFVESLCSWLHYNDNRHEKYVWLNRHLPLQLRRRKLFYCTTPQHSKIHYEVATSVRTLLTTKFNIIARHAKQYEPLPNTPHLANYNLRQTCISTQHRSGTSIHHYYRHTVHLGIISHTLVKLFNFFSKHCVDIWYPYLACLNLSRTQTFSPQKKWWNTIRSPCITPVWVRISWLFLVHCGGALFCIGPENASLIVAVIMSEELMGKQKLKGETHKNGKKWSMCRKVENEERGGESGKWRIIR